MNSILWKGVSSTTINGLLICELPPISKPPLRVKETMIDGRDGSVIEELGYSSYDKSITIGLRGNFDINKVIKYFTGEGEIVFSNEPEKVYTAKVISQVDYNRLLQFRTAVVTFRVQPFKHKYNEAYKETQTATVMGTSIVVTDSAEANLKAFSIYGKSTQNGTPTPEAPVDIVSLCADGTISVTANDTTVELAVANGLRGIPVTDKRLATYTDASGKMWCADEIDLERGVYVQRVNKFTPTSSNAGGLYELGGYARASIYFNIKQSINTPNGLCNIASMVGNYVLDELHFYMQNAQLWLFAPVSEIEEKNANGVAKWFIDRNAEFYYILATPVETALTDEEIAVCNAIKAIVQDTTITNDEGAYMKVESFKPYEVFNEGLESSKPIMVLRGSGTVGISVNGMLTFEYTFPEGETEVVIDSEKEDAYLGSVLKNRNMNGEFPVLLPGTNIIEWSGDVESIEVLPRSRWL